MNAPLDIKQITTPHWCQAHAEPTRAVQFYRHRWRCQSCITAIRQVNGRSNKHKPAASKAFVSGRLAHERIDTSEPMQAPDFRPLRPMAEHQRYAEYKREFAPIKSLVRD